ncbi:MAG: tetratricopeptide repeat protein, partial [Nannocystaceae bacterium]|nr:tetratricopeptide repeat protein [Nannocystaceae bacterium]
MRRGEANNGEGERQSAGLALRADEPTQRVTNASDPDAVSGSALEDTASVQPVARNLPEAGQMLGRYVVLENLGEGGMGVVVAAFDPALERRVALKLVRPSSDDHAAAARHRIFLLREAQALAALSHPNVVPVYDVGEFPIPDSPPGVYVAMELEDGETLRRWAKTSRPWWQVVDVFIQAGRGLAAAHAAGIVHGDFKPANVLYRRDGRVVVLDFGLARYRGAALADADVPSHSVSALGVSMQSSLPPGEATMGGAGFIMGTPAYLAPEQYDGVHEATADQFSYCVALYRTLFGRHPFAAGPDRDGERDALVRRIRGGVPAHVPRTRRRLARVARIVLRGLAHDPERRWPSMDALLDALVSARRFSIWPIVAGGAVMVLAGLAGFVVATSGSGDSTVMRTASCDQEFGLSQAWSESRRVQLHDALQRLKRSGTAASEQAWLDETASVAGRDLDRYAAAWSHERRGVCENRRGSHASALRSGRQRACLDDALAAMTTLVDGLLEADATTWASLGRPTARLARPEACREVGASRSNSAAEGEEVRRARRMLATGRANLHAGQHEAAIGAARRVADVALERSAPELAARADWLLGEALADAGDYPGALRHLRHAAWGCSLLSCDGLTLQAMSDMVKILSSDLVDFDQAVRWERRARRVLEERGLSEPFADVALYNAIGLLRLAQGDYEESEAAFRYAVKRAALASDAEFRLAGVYNNLGNALEAQGRSAEAIEVATQSIVMRERELGRHHPSLASALSNLAISELVVGDVHSARGHLRRAIAITLSAWGPDHPNLANYYNNLANVHYEQGEWAAARVEYRRTLQVLRRSLGEEHPYVGLTLGNLGLVTEDPHEALALHRAALAALKLAVPDRHPHIALTYNNIGSALRRLEQYDAAREYYGRALEIREDVLGPKHPLTATTIDNLGRNARAAGDPELAISYHRRSLSMWTASYGDLHRRVVFAKTGLANALLDAFRGSEAEVLRARVLAQAAVDACSREANDADPVDRAEAELVLARALLDGPDQDPRRARRLAQRARKVLTGPSVSRQ